MLKIDDIRIDSPLILAPMAGVNCTAFRLMCREAGAGMVFTQMYHCDFLTHKLEKDGRNAVLDFVNILPEERPVALQLIGNDPARMIESARIFEKKADMIDINLSCPDKNMIEARCGGYYSHHPEKIDELVRPIAEEVKTPVSAKIRIGWDSQSINGVSVAQGLEKMGVAAISIHGRTVEQKFRGQANWEILRHIKEKLSIPVIGNGDVRNAAKAVEMKNRTGCDFVMIGRRAMGDPGFFTRCNNRLHDDEIKVPDGKEMFLKFLQYYQRYDNSKSFNELRTHALWFAKRAGLGAMARKSMSAMQDIESLKAMFK